MTNEDISGLLVDVLAETLLADHEITLRDLLVSAGVYPDDIDSMQRLVLLLGLTTLETMPRLGNNAVMLGFATMLHVIYRLARDGKLTVPAPVGDA